MKLSPDELLRRSGFEIRLRPAGQPAQWRYGKDGPVMSEAEALAMIQQPVRLELLRKAGLRGGLSR